MRRVINVIIIDLMFSSCRFLFSFFFFFFFFFDFASLTPVFNVRRRGRTHDPFQTKILTQPSISPQNGEKFIQKRKHIGLQIGILLSFFNHLYICHHSRHLVEYTRFSFSSSLLDTKCKFTLIGRKAKRPCCDSSHRTISHSMNWEIRNHT